MAIIGVALALVYIELSPKFNNNGGGGGGSASGGVEAALDNILEDY